MTRPPPPPEPPHASVEEDAAPDASEERPSDPQASDAPRPGADAPPAADTSEADAPVSPHDPDPPVAEADHAPRANAVRDDDVTDDVTDDAEARRVPDDTDAPLVADEGGEGSPAADAPLPPRDDAPNGGASPPSRAGARDPAQEATAAPEGPPPPPSPWQRPYAQNNREPWGFIVRAMAYEVLVVLVTAAAIAVLAFTALQGSFQDFYVKLRPHAPVSGEVALLTIGPEALYLWNPDEPDPTITPRGLLAELVRFLHAAEASVIVLDLLLDRAADGDDALVEAAAAHGAVVGAERLRVTEPASGREFVAGIAPSLLEGMYSGYANFQAEQSMLFSGDLLVRRVPLLRRADRSHLTGSWPANVVGGRQDIDQIVPSLALMAATLHRRGPQKADAIATALQRGCTSRPLVCTLTADDLGLPAIPHPLSEPLAINFRGPEHADGLPTVTAARALRVNAQAALLRDLGVDQPIEVPRDVRALVSGKVVVVGRVDADAGDRFFTPYALPVPIEPDMAGPRIHAHIIDTLLTGRHIRTLPPWVSLLLGLASALAVVLAWRRRPDHTLAFAVVALAAGLFTLGAVVFHLTDGYALEVGPALLGLLGTLFLLTLRGWILDNASRG